MNNIYQNLEAQFNKLFRHINVGSYKTRERYAKAFKRFMVFLAREYRLQKLSNISQKHILAYLKFMQSKNLAASTVKTELAAIRFFHDSMPYTRENLPTNDDLNLKRRTFGGVDRTWTNQEYNLMQSKAAIASGGLTGNHTGILTSVPVKESDFIFAAISEHMGFIGTTAVIILAFFFLCRCLYVAAKVPSKSASYMLTGFTGYFAFHYIENMGMAVGLLPITGIPLPFISYGGTAMLINYLAFGVILNISMSRNT